MAATPSSLAMRRTQPRERIYSLLLGQPRRSWTVRQVTNALAGRGWPSADGRCSTCCSRTTSWSPCQGNGR
jgi:hypothetical protein